MTYLEIAGVAAIAAAVTSIIVIVLAATFTSWDNS